MIVEEQLNRTEFQSGSINVGTMFREDQSEAVTQGMGEIRAQGGSIRDKTFKALANKTNQ